MADAQERLLAEITRLRERWQRPRKGVAFGSPEGDGGPSDPRLALLLEHMRAMLVETDARGIVHSVSPSVETVLGYQPDEFVGTRSGELVHPDDLPKLSAVVHQLIEGVDPPRPALRLRHKSGHWVWIERIASVLFETAEGETRTLSISRDVTELKTAADALRENEERYRIIATMAPDAILETDPDGKLLFSSPVEGDVFGYPADELLTLEPYSKIHPDDVERLREHTRVAMEERTPLRSEPYRLRHGDGHWIWLETTGLAYDTADGIRRFLSVTSDVTERLREERERREFQERIQQAQRLESLGVMAGGIAHDFNNLLTPILGDTSLALMDLPPESPLRERLERVLKAGHRAAALTNQMLAYAGADSLEVRSVELNRLVQEMGELVEGAVAGKAVLEYRLADRLPILRGDPSQLGQVVMNLISNATEAVGEGEGRITVRTAVTSIEEPVRDHLGQEIPSGQYVEFEVEDTGCGMDDATRARIFDPFFTTKFAGRGLGLAAVLGIVRGHDGAIQIESAPQRGTRFRVLLPESIHARAASPSAEAQSRSVWQADATALVVDDEPAVRHFVEDTLRQAGLSVLTAPDGREGAETFAKNADRISLVPARPHDARHERRRRDAGDPGSLGRRPDHPDERLFGGASVRAPVGFGARGLPAEALPALPAARGGPLRPRGRPVIELRRRRRSSRRRPPIRRGPSACGCR